MSADKTIDDSTLAELIEAAYARCLTLGVGGWKLAALANLSASLESAEDALLDD